MIDNWVMYILQNSGLTLYLGRDSTNYFKGKIDEVSNSLKSRRNKLISAIFPRITEVLIVMKKHAGSLNDK